LRDNLDPLVSLSAGNGDGSLLGAAAGDVAGRANSTGYSALMQQMIVLCYHLMQREEVTPSQLVEEMAVLGRSTDGPSLYRDPSPAFATWIAAAVDGRQPVPINTPTAEPAALVVPIGLWFRRDPEALLTAASTVAEMFTSDPVSLVAAGAVAGAVAASTVAQSGPDLVLAGAELAEMTVARLGLESTAAKDVGLRLRKAVALLGKAPLEIAEALTGGQPVGVDTALISIVLAAPVVREPSRIIEGAAALGGSLLGAMVGAMVGGRVGIRVWPWEIPNDGWFAELGRRLSRGSREYIDLPIPYDAEEYLMTAPEARRYRF